MRKGRRINRMQESRFKLIQNRIRITTVERQCNLQTYVNHVSCLYLWSIRHNCKERQYNKARKVRNCRRPIDVFDFEVIRPAELKKRKGKGKLFGG